MYEPILNLQTVSYCYSALADGHVCIDACVVIVCVFLPVCRHFSCIYILVFSASSSHAHFSWNLILILKDVMINDLERF